MELANGRILLFLPAYYNRRYVNVPLFHLPEGAITNEGDIVQFRCVPVDNPPKVDPLPMRESKAVEKYSAFEEVTIYPETLSDCELKELCKINDIPLAWVTNRFTKKANESSGSLRRRENRKVKSLTSSQFNKIIKKLKKIDEQSALIVEILWFINSSLEEGGAYATLEEILRAKVHDFSPEEESRPPQICLRRSAGKSHIISHFLPEEIGQRISLQAKLNSMFIFSNREGGPVLPVKVNSDLKRAGENVGIRNITSLSLRPQFNKSEVQRAGENHQQGAASSGCPRQVTSEEWEVVCERIPFINQRRGRKSAYHPRELLNGILYHLKMPCPLRKLPSSFPPWRAIDSQFRRWRKRGIIEEVMEVLNER